MVGLHVIVVSEFGEYVGILGPRYLGGMYLRDARRIIKKPGKNDFYSMAINGFSARKLDKKVDEIFIRGINMMFSCSKKSIKTL